MCKNSMPNSYLSTTDDYSILAICKMYLSFTQKLYL